MSGSRSSGASVKLNTSVSGSPRWSTSKPTALSCCAIRPAICWLVASSDVNCRVIVRMSSGTPSISEAASSGSYASS